MFRQRRQVQNLSVVFLCALCDLAVKVYYSLRCVVSTCLAIARASPSIVYSRASIFGLKPACRSVSLVTGPIDASHISRSPCQWSFSSNYKKFVAVDELVNVTMSGRAESLEKRRLSLAFARLGHMRFIGFGYIHFGAALSNLGRQNIAGYLCPDQQYALPFCLVLQRFHHGFGNVSVRRHALRSGRVFQFPAASPARSPPPEDAPACPAQCAAFSAARTTLPRRSRW